jgi:cbb3-type cytochrome oxidase maturation protein
MNILGILLPVAIILGAVFAVLFVVAVRHGQFDDLDDPPRRMLKDD